MIAVAGIGFAAPPRNSAIGRSASFGGEIPGREVDDRERAQPYAAAM